MSYIRPKPRRWLVMPQPNRPPVVTRAKDQEPWLPGFLPKGNSATAITKAETTKTTENYE